MHFNIISVFIFVQTEANFSFTGSVHYWPITVGLRSRWPITALDLLPSLKFLLNIEKIPRIFQMSNSIRPMTSSQMISHYFDRQKWKIMGIKKSKIMLIMMSTVWLELDPKNCPMAIRTGSQRLVAGSERNGLRTATWQAVRPNFGMQSRETKKRISMISLRCLIITMTSGTSNLRRVSSFETDASRSSLAPLVVLERRKLENAFY